jgi:ribulose-phosphate 3-epimerase
VEQALNTRVINILLTMKEKKTFNISASIICGNIFELKKNIQLLERAKVEYIHFDVMDGVFVPRYGLYPEILQTIRSITSIPINIHLMVQNPDPYIPLFIKSGGNFITVHAEACSNLSHTLEIIRQHGGQSGVAINPSTSLDVIDQVLDHLDLIMLMAIIPGIKGQSMIPGTIQKIKKLKKKLINHPDILISIDGGVQSKTAPQMIKAGANLLVCGTSSIFKTNTPLDRSVQKFRNLILK